MEHVEGEADYPVGATDNLACKPHNPADETDNLVGAIDYLRVGAEYPAGMKENPGDGFENLAAVPE